MRTLLSAVNEASIHTPHGPWAFLPGLGPHGESSWSPMTWLQLKTAVDRMAFWVESQLGLAVPGSTIAYMGSNDIRYPIVLLACMKIGYTVLLASPRNSTHGHSSLFKSVECELILYSSELRNQVDQVIANHKAITTAIQVPEVLDFLAETRDKIPQSKSPVELKEEDTVIILHSSGTTGLPKPIYLKAGALAVIDTIKQMQTPPGRRNVHDELYTPTIMISMLPFFHIMGIAILLRAIYHRGPLVLLPADKPITADTMVDAINQVRPSAIATAPSILEAMSCMSGGLEALSKVEFVFYGGAPLAQSSGNKISKITTLLNGIGSTEILNVPSYVPQDPKDWEYFEWNPEYGVAMEDRQNGSFELIVKQKYNQKHQLVFHNFPHLSEWKTSDLFERHPAKQNLWRHIGRADDTIVLTNGEKVTPVLFEKAIEGHELVKGALLVGSQRFQTGLIIEPSNYKFTTENGFLDRLWPSIDASNIILPSHAKVWRHMVILAQRDKPFLRAPKGSVKRQTTCQLYEEEINCLYNGEISNVPKVEKGSVPSATYSIQNIQIEIRRAVDLVLPSPLSDDDDFFHNGMDSLKAIQLHRTLLLSHSIGGGLFSNSVQLPLIAIYKNPTVNRLADFVVNVALRGSAVANKTSSREERMSGLIYKYSKSFPLIPASRRIIRMSEQEISHVVILTGSTGSLGTYILHNLLSQSQIRKVYCLNRSTDASERTERAFQERNLDLSAFNSKVVFLTVDLTKLHFGLASSQYETLENEVTFVIHNAWPVNFNNNIDYFMDSIYGTRQLIDLAIAAPHQPRFIFVSSIASVGNFSSVRPDESIIPEQMDEDNSLPLAQGYGESKHVVSSIISRAARLSGLSGAIVRVGQLSGPDDGVAARWNKAEWLPAMVLTSKNLGKIPSSLGGHDALGWVPVNKAAEILLELTMPSFGGSSCDADRDSGLECHNLVNPQMGHWGDMVHAIQEYYRTRAKPVERVDFSGWIRELEKMEVTETAVARYPAIKLLDFYREMSLQSPRVNVKYATHLGEARSPVLAELKPVNAKLMESWLRGWDCKE
ncbi:hypothetical protein BGZ63DRAFT_248815 [Mariannaea sp. PMI_226]|nr:hypothetical protein BGZ63DRAFT_248815 [Mariannaea sp. PMI_226]